MSELEQYREDNRGANTLVLQVIAAGVAALAIVFALTTSEEGSVLQGVNWFFLFCGRDNYSGIFIRNFSRH